MKVLFVSSDAGPKDSLNIRQEITELQMQAARAAGEEVRFMFLPSLSFEELPSQIHSFAPDILHIAAHANPDYLSLMDAAGKPVAISARALGTFLPPTKRPRLVYLSACNSDSMAQALTAKVPMAIGTNMPITNRAARTGATIFYQKLFAGESVEAAFNASREAIVASQNRKVKSVLRCQSGVTPANEIMYRVPTIVAGLVDGSRSSGTCAVRFGMVGCPANVRQVVFFTDDESFDQNDDRGHDMCAVAVGKPSGPTRELWVDEEDEWEDIDGDFAVFAVAVTADRKMFSVSCMLSDALEHCPSHSAFAKEYRNPSRVVGWFRGKP